MSERTKRDDLGSQIWEECRKCGKEPIYTRFDLCEDCSFPSGWKTIDNSTEESEEKKK